MSGWINYYAVMILMVAGLYLVLSSNHLVRKILGLNIFQTSVFIFFISIGKVRDATAPILEETSHSYSNPLTHVLILTAIVVSVATTTLALALVVRIKRAFGTVDEARIQQSLEGEQD